MNGKQRAKRYAEAVADLQRLYKQVRGAPESPFLQKSIVALQEACTTASSAGDETRSPGKDDAG